MEVSLPVCMFGVGAVHWVIIMFLREGARQHRVRRTALTHHTASASHPLLLSRQSVHHRRPSTPTKILLFRFNSRVLFTYTSLNRLINTLTFWLNEGSFFNIEDFK